MGVEATHGQSQKPWLMWAGIVAVVTFLVFLLYEFVVQAPLARTAHRVAEVEFHSIRPPANARELGLRSSDEPGEALVDATYLTSASLPELLTHYDAELSRQGWRFVGTSNVSDWGRDLGGMTAHYCKGDYEATIQYAGDEANYGWTYACSVSWSCESDCLSRSAGGLVKLSVSESLFMLTFGSFFALLATKVGRAAWTKNPEEYVQWRRERGKLKRTIFRFPSVSPGYVVWNDRLLSILGAVLGLLAALVGLVSLLRNFVGG